MSHGDGDWDEEVSDIFSWMAVFCDGTFSVILFILLALAFGLYHFLGA